MSDFVINDYILNQEARYIVDEILSQAGDGQDIEEMIDQVVDGHEWVINTYKAYILCAECNTTQGEEMLANTGQTFSDIGEHVTAVAYWTLWVASWALAMSNRDKNIRDKNIRDKNIVEAKKCLQELLYGSR